MDPQDYQHVCERAELLGLPKPSEEEWRQTQTTQNEDRCNDDDGDALQVIGEKNSCESRVRSIRGKAETAFRYRSNGHDGRVFRRAVRHQGSIRCLLLVAVDRSFREKFEIRVKSKRVKPEENSDDG